MVVLSIETVGEERFIRGFNRYVAEMRDFREVFEDIAQDFWRIEEKNFDAQGTPQSFAPLSPRYKAWKDAHYPGKKIMELTGRLRGSLTGENQADFGDTIKKIGRTSAEFGTQVPYAHRHQMGAGGMPRRKIVQLTEEDKRRWGRMIQRWAFQKLQEELDEPTAPSLKSARSY